MKSYWKSLAVSVATVFALVLALYPLGALALNDPRDWDHSGRVNFQGPLQIDNVEVTATAAELNIMDGVTVSAAQINAAGAGSAATITATTITNLNLKIYGTNITLTGSVSVPAGSLEATDVLGTATTNGQDITASTLISNKNLKVYGTNITLTGAVDIPAGSLEAADVLGTAVTNGASIAATVLTGNIDVARITNAIATATGALTTNVFLNADGAKTNTLVLREIGGKYVIESISVSP